LLVFVPIYDCCGFGSFVVPTKETEIHRQIYRVMKIALSSVLFCLFAVFSVMVKNQLRQEKSPLVALPLGTQMPAFTLPDRAGNPVTFGEGPPVAKLTMINFWATWCGPCRLEMPGFEKLYAAKQKEGFLILAINEDEKASDLEAYLKAKPVSFPVLVDRDSALAKRFGVRAYPTTILVDGDGRIVKVIEGLDPYLEFVVEGHLSGHGGEVIPSHVIDVQLRGNGKPEK
jgi:thiol-disulfide isomerase/thioredoxin